MSVTVTGTLTVAITVTVAVTVTVTVLDTGASTTFKSATLIVTYNYLLFLFYCFYVLLRLSIS